MKKISFTIVIALALASCVSTKSTLKNVDNNAPIPRISAQNTFIITEMSQDKRYGYEKDYPINVFYNNTANDTLNSVRFIRALAGPKGEKISYTKLESCCPFPTKTSGMGAGFLDVYELKWEGQKKPIQLYLNIYERGYLLAPVGLSIKK
ncbi:2-dehydro-3-deoxyphosphooctonate aldolase [Flavobacterium faecale]|uniref:2-dehydro-3-deoxyphosphooctonate aldolase n=1 Tax=Flavobacterium faecale TaxID=1355330 RepID=A0A2S1LFC7_9FLAO|nr:2-dehydro-3-deoxyphosphooctonate aldolase [Flavobacterium faecale]AWG22361.1 2-dehydro-3-deoxyphosphooctonate aldolase [Flavobacterium faecale]